MEKLKRFEKWEYEEVELTFGFRQVKKCPNLMNGSMPMNRFQTSKRRQYYGWAITYFNGGFATNGFQFFATL